MMSLPQNTATVLQFMFPALQAQRDWAVRNDGTQVTIDRWEAAEPKPDANAITAAANSPEFAAWLASWTDPVKRRRVEAKQILATSNDPLIVAVRAALKGIGASLREVRQAQGKPVRNDNQFMADVMAGIDAGAGEV